MKYVSVLYLNEEAQVYTGRAYTYKTSLPVESMDRVIAPVGYKGEKKRAVVFDDNVSIDTIPDDIVGILKEITEWDDTE